MRFMMMVKGDDKYEAGTPPSPELMAAIGRLEKQDRQAGIVLESGGLLPSSKGAKIRAGRGKLTVIDGPRRRARSLVSG